MKFFFEILSYIVMPCVWAETLLFWILGQRPSTSFRMFPPPDIVPDYPAGLAYAYALVLVMCIPGFISSDQQWDGRATLGGILRPLTRRASPSVVSVIMFARVWLLVACTNAALAQFLTDVCPWTFAGKMGCLFFIL